MRGWHLPFLCRRFMLEIAVALCYDVSIVRNIEGPKLVVNG